MKKTFLKVVAYVFNVIGFCCIGLAVCFLVNNCLGKELGAVIVLMSSVSCFAIGSMIKDLSWGKEYEELLEKEESK